MDPSEQNRPDKATRTFRIDTRGHFAASAWHVGASARPRQPLHPPPSHHVLCPFPLVHQHYDYASTNVITVPAVQRGATIAAGLMQHGSVRNYMQAICDPCGCSKVPSAGTLLGEATVTSNRLVSSWTRMSSRVRKQPRHAQGSPRISMLVSDQSRGRGAGWLPTAPRRPC